ncbi:hypothetical protein [Longibaculum muris]|uniref:hypothetical protein n=1 Tax=Longibaculum muris TaxID=1796628 RepID=UPI0022E8951D|nr:hypothetical protein [Longibaculum muris]
MEKKIGRLITISGKVIYFRQSIESISKYKFDKYNLEKQHIYIDYINCSNELKEKQIIESINNLEFETNEYIYSIYYLIKPSSIKEIQEIILNQPLTIFDNLSLLKDKNFLDLFIAKYPTFIFTFMKEEYRKYISLKEIVDIFIKYDFFPLQNLYDDLIKEILSREIYQYKFIDYFIEKSNFIHFFNTSKKDISKDVISDFKLMIQTISNLLNDKNFIDNLFDYVQDTWFYNCLLLLDQMKIKKSSQMIIEEKIKMIDEESKIRQIKIKDYYHYLIEELSLLTNALSHQYQTIADILYKIIYLEKYYIFPSYLPLGITTESISILNYLPSYYLNKKDFLVIMAKKGIPLSAYSKKLKKDLEILYYEIKYFPEYIEFVPIELFSNKKFIFMARTICPNILQYVNINLLDNYEFMLEYIQLFGTKDYFKLGYNLSLNKDFMYEAIFYDQNIIFYCHKKILSDAIFMYNIIISTGDSAVRFLNKDLKNNNQYMNNFINEQKEDVFSFEKTSEMEIIIEEGINNMKSFTGRR